ncbi:hypothetical protein [Jeotgalibacillus soli]|uniref:Uncharacterized protein n=1 Tax=Jeotgalibacillus soli TaxID=889306 RepID=A0A0C2RPD1_9BACL|nr:hypothetical protein [Jeotgalibacillus soli]KIL52110.1 hypothetical protein KP78_04800 [Jeotgalibacillus soli]
MRRSSWLGIGFFLIGIGVLIFAYAPGIGPNPKNELYEYSSSGLRLNVVTNGERFTEGDNIEVEVTLVNELGAPITYDVFCERAIELKVKAVDIDEELRSKPKQRSCKDHKEKSIMNVNEQITIDSTFKLEIPFNEEDTILAPSGNYEIQILFYPTAQNEFIYRIPIEIVQENPELVNINDARAQAMDTNKASGWFLNYRDGEKYVISEEIPYIEDGHWIFTWKAMNADQSVDLPDKELVVAVDALKEE